MILRLAGSADLFHTPDDKTAYASISVDSHRETWAVRSRGFRRWLVSQFYEANGKPPTDKALSEALAVLEARAQFSGASLPVFLRVAAAGDDAVYLDLGTAEWEAVEITASGWRIVSDAPVRFRRTRGSEPLPYPVSGGSVNDLRAFLNVDEPSFRLVVGWLIGALHPTGPYPVLVLHGEQGTGKSTLSKVLRSLTDPSSTSLRAQPRDVRDLAIAAANNWVFALDNLSYLSRWLSDALCRLATGGGFATRELYTDTDEMVFDIKRPVILNSIEELVTQSDLLDRSLNVELAPITDNKRQTEAEFWRDFEKARPSILGVLLDAVAAALRNRWTVELTARPRMADFAIFVTAAEEVLDWHAGTFLEAYERNRDDASHLALESSVVGQAIVSGRFIDWSGTAGQLLSELIPPLDPAGRRQPGWPRTARALRGQLNRIVPNLRRAGYAVTFTREPGGNRTRLVHIQKLAEQPSHPSPTVPTGANPSSEQTGTGTVTKKRKPNQGR
jgi:hypothetical protein